MILTYKNEPLQIEKGATYLSVAKKVQNEYDAPIILAKLGQKIVELNKTIPDETELIKCGRSKPTLSFITTRDRDGHKTYERGATMMFLRAMTHVYGKWIKRLKLEYAVGESLYFTIKFKDGTGAEAIKDEQLAEIKETMLRYVRDDEKFVKTKIPTEEAIELFRRHGMTDKERLFNYRRTSVTNVYRLGNYCDYFYGYMPPSAGYVNIFDIFKTNDGIFLTIPYHNRPTQQGLKYIPAKLFATMHDTTVWSENIGVSTVAALNDAIMRGEGRNIILASEAYQEHTIGQMAKRIKDENRRIVMIAGPSSSGKTTFSKRLMVQLMAHGLTPKVLSLDDYFLDRDHTPLDENGEHDFESLYAIDLPFFNQQLKDLLAGKSIQPPRFNFKKGGIREFTAPEMTLGDNDILLIEGIHALNPDLMPDIPADSRFLIYVSALTCIRIDQHNYIPTTDNRLLRRITRDHKYRSYSAQDTIGRWASVRAGEEKWIFPYQENADAMFNSAMIFEIAVIKDMVAPLLDEVPENCPEYAKACQLKDFLKLFKTIPSQNLPPTSLVREFIGGSSFHY